MKSISFIIPAISILAFSGCETLYNASNRRQEANESAMRVAMERQQMSRDIDVTKAAAQSAEMQIQNLDTRISQLESNIRQTGNAASTDITALQREIASLKSETAAIRADRETMKKEIVSEISSEVAKMLAAQQKSSASASRNESVSQSGYEHKVQSGQTLSAIAQAYNVSVEKIKKANNLKSDVIRVGQTLFIPD